MQPMRLGVAGGRTGARTLSPYGPGGFMARCASSGNSWTVNYA